jgi:predicted esterase
MSDWINLLATVTIVQMAVVLAMVESDLAYKNEKLHVVWFRRAGFGAGGATLLYMGYTHDWEFACLLMVSACVVIFSVNLLSLFTRNNPPVHGHRLLARTAAFWRRYP